MNQTISVWILIAVALVAANLPFFNDKILACIRMQATDQGQVRQSARASKSIWIRLLELVVLYCLVGFLGYFFESTLGNPFRQKWEFYAITFSLFVVLAFPGFVLRYLMRRG